MFMDWDDVEKLVKCEKTMEGYSYEFKEMFGEKYEDTGNRRIAEAIVSLANSDGGKLFIGIRDHPIELIGINSSDWEDQNKVSEYIRNILIKNKVSPEIFERYILLQPILNQQKDRVVIFMEVEKGLKPYYIDGRILIRGANGKILLTDFRDINNFLISRSEGDLIYKELLRAYQNRIVPTQYSPYEITGWTSGEAKYVVYLEKNERDTSGSTQRYNPTIKMLLVTFGDAFENLPDIIKRNHYLFINKEELRDELLALCVYWNHYREIWHSYFVNIEEKGRLLVEIHIKILKVLPKAIKDFEEEFHITPSGIKD